MSKKHGDSETFDKSWQNRKEAYYTHWIRGTVTNQIQLAFRNHWTLFNKLMKNEFFNNGKRFLEVGCGRGSISAYFCDVGYECTLLDISENVIRIAQEIFRRNGLNANFKVGDVIQLPFDNNSFDIIVSIGLLEHFKDGEIPIREQIRVLDKGGILIVYIVPKYTNNVQKDFEWINNILKGYVAESKDTGQPPKSTLYRSDDDSRKYIKIMKKYNLREIQSSGVYPLPMISHSIEFPFTLMPKKCEEIIVAHFKSILEKRKRRTGNHPWLCEEGYGQAFLVWGYK